jgi:hypothetical protein
MLMEKARFTRSIVLRHAFDPERSERKNLVLGTPRFIREIPDGR